MSRDFAARSALLASLLVSGLLAFSANRLLLWGFPDSALIARHVPSLLAGYLCWVALFSWAARLLGPAPARPVRRPAGDGRSKA